MWLLRFLLYILDTCNVLRSNEYFRQCKSKQTKKNSTRREKECVFSLFCCCCWCELIACALDRVLLAYPARIVSESSLHISIDDLCASHTHTYRANVRTQYVVLFGLVVSPSIQSAFVFLWWLFGKCIPLHLKFSEHFVVMYCIYIFIFPFSSIVMHVMVLSSAWVSAIAIAIDVRAMCANIAKRKLTEQWIVEWVARWRFVRRCNRSRWHSAFFLFFSLALSADGYGRRALRTCNEQ